MAVQGDVAPIAKGLSGSFQAVEPWQRGSGSEPLTVGRHIADLHELTTDLCDGSPPALVGHSWGAMLALCYAAEHPSMAGPIVLVGCGTFDQSARSRMQRIIQDRIGNGLRDHLSRISDEIADPLDRLIRKFKLTRHLFNSDPIGPYPDGRKPRSEQLLSPSESDIVMHKRREARESGNCKERISCDC